LDTLRNIQFSRHGTLLDTAAALVSQSPAGCFTDELDAVVQVATKDALRRLVHQHRHQDGAVAVLPVGGTIRSISTMADNSNVPLVVDLDGTLIRTDLLWESLARLLRRNPLAIFPVLCWWLRGRALLKQKLAARVQINPAALPYHQKFLAWLREEKKSGRKIILATASDGHMAQPVADHLGLFDEVLASDGRTNLRAQAKRRVLTEKFGERGFDYAGNSRDDLIVWRGARAAIVVNARRRVQREAAQCARPGPVFCDHFSALANAQNFCTELFWRSGYLTAVLAGLLLASAFPNWNFSGFAWIAPALMIFAAHGKSGPDAFRVGCVAGLAFWLASLGWLLRIPVTGFPILGWLALAAYLALFSGAWVALVSRWGERLRGREPSLWASRTLWALGGAAAWVALEMLRARLFGGFPWSLLGDSQFKIVPLIQLAAVTGVYGVSFLVVWFSLALFSAGRMISLNPSHRQVWLAEIILPLSVTVFCYIGGFHEISRAAPAEKGLRVTLIQPNVPQTLIWSASDDARRFRELLDQSQHALTNPTDLLIWPESAVPAIDEATYEAISQFARTNQVWIILNGDDVEFHPHATNWFNAAFLIGPDGHLHQRYHKRQLVIFGEYVPLAGWLPFLKWFTPITGGWTPGDKTVQFEITRGGKNSIPVASGDTSRSPVKISPLICFEDVFPGTVRDTADDDTDFLVNLTNDGWFGDSAAQWQHTAAAVFRTVENRQSLVRCANNGVTCWIDACGQIQKVLTDPAGNVHGAGTLTLEIPLRTAAEKETVTFYHRHGDWFGWGCVGITLAGLLAGWLGRRTAGKR
jgi:apolipoprotein N-acyltransferase